MGHDVAKGEEFERKAEKKIKGWGLFSSKYEDAADLYQKAANSFKLSKSWDRAATAYIKLASCNLKSDSKHEAASAYGDSANCYKKISPKQAISSLDQAVNLLLEINRFNMAARYCKEIGELYEQEQNMDRAITYFERAADLYQTEEVNTSSSQCRQKVAEFSAQLGKYQTAAEIYEEVAGYALNNNLLKYGARGHLLNAGICQLCKGDVVAINNALEKYQDLDPTFSRTRECKLLAALAVAFDEEDAAKFTVAVKEFDSITKLGYELEETELSTWFTKNNLDAEQGKVIVKPARAGSSIGVTVAYGVTDSLRKAHAIISEGIDDKVLVEIFLEGGREFTTIVLDVSSGFDCQPVALLPAEV